MTDIVDLFCGVGGLSLGAVQAGFRPRLAIDIDPVLSDGHRRNHPSCGMIVGDLATMEPSELRARSRTSGRLSGVVGGPPCQGFSSIGKRRPDDPRNLLLQRFFDLVENLRPKFFLMENVPGLLLDEGPKTLQAALSALRHPYVVLEPMILNAADYGAATTRKRLVVIGYDPTEVNSLELADVLAVKSAKQHTVRDAIGDLPGPNDTGIALLGADNSKSEYVSTLNSFTKPAAGSEVGPNKSERNAVSGFQLTHHTRAVVDRFSHVLPGSKDSVSRYVRLTWDRPANVLRAGTGSDRGSFQAARPIHPSENRVITVREAARIQGFPDWYEFHETKWHSHRMIGNSVSPPFAHALLSLIASRMDMGA